MANNWQETNDPTNTSNSFSSTTKQYSNNYQTMKSDDENEELETISKLKEENDYNQQIQILKMRISELEDWNTDFSKNTDLQSQIDLLTTRNRQLETDYQRLQSQQKNNQLALERLDEYEETIAQLQEELNELHSNKKNSALIEEQQRSETLQKLLEQTRLESNEKILDLETKLQHFQVSSMTPGSPPTMVSSSDNLVNTQQLNSIYDQFVSLLPNEYSMSDHQQSSLFDRFTHLAEQFSSYIGTFSIIQEEFESLKQILQEKQDELEKLRTHCEITTDKLNQIQEEQSLENKFKQFDSDEDELEEILHRASSQQSLLSITPGEKQQLIAQNELLSTLLTEKEQELIDLQQAEKMREDLRKNFQQIQHEKDVQQIELNDIKHVLDEKIRENSSLKKEKMFFIEKISEFERLRQEQQSCIQIRTSPSNNNEQYQQLLSEYTTMSTLYNQTQSLIQQKTEAYLQCQNELNTFKNLFYEQKKKSDDIEELQSMLNERTIQLEQLKINEQELIAKKKQLEIDLQLLQEQNTKMLANETFFTQNQIDLKRITHERDLAIIEKKQIEQQLQNHSKSHDEFQLLQEINRTLQINLEQVQLEREKHLTKYEEQILTTARLTNENNEMNERLNEELQMKNLLINQLQSEIESKTKEIVEFDANIQTTNQSKVEKQLVKNILLSFLNTPIDKQQEALPLLGALVGFTQDEYQKAIEALANNYQNTAGSSWLTGWLGNNSTKMKLPSQAPVYHPEKSFAELLIQYVDQQSTDNSQASVLNTGTSNHTTQFI